MRLASTHWYVVLALTAPMYWLFPNLQLDGIGGVSIQTSLEWLDISSRCYLEEIEIASGSPTSTFFVTSLLL